jgi:solute carrier family 15 (oligopeptide transporter), member 1
LYFRTFTIIGLLLIALGSGGIKPCVAAFGGEQFKLPQQAAQLAVFFSLFYFSVNAGSLISTSVTPILREDVSCFGMPDCFPLAFGVPAALMFVSILIFLGGKFLYKILPIQGNMLVKVFQCIGVSSLYFQTSKYLKYQTFNQSAIKTRKLEKTSNPREHWLEYAESTHGKKLVMETKILLNVLVLYLPLPFFWALFDQQGSRWTFQATRMSGDIGFMEIKPDQMQVINPLLILVFIPLYEVLFYPLLSLIGVRRPLQKLTIGGILAGVAFVISAIVEINLENTYPVLPQSNEGQFRIFNGKSCDYSFTSNITEIPTFSLRANQLFEEKFIKVDGEKGTSFQVTVASATPASCQADIGAVKTFNLPEKSARSFFMFGESIESANQVNSTMFEDSAEKSRNGRPLLRVLANIHSNSQIKLMDSKDNLRYNETKEFIGQDDYPASTYKVFIGDREILTEMEMKLGGVYTLIINERGTNDFAATLNVISEPNSMNMLWLIPQYVVMTLGEVNY